ncbi:MAG: hypothetical protein OXQ29_03720 [Rhodospirillaceae bacterium]|nr:hypothetical protein [Rhodospirillaceae bacterium]
MPRFRKLPVEVDAVQWDGSDAAWDAICRLGSGGSRALHRGAWCITIDTLEGEMLADDGDWIIKGVKGEIYPCKTDIFEATHEPLD